jgi:osmotically-inducible protein OsmY
MSAVTERIEQELASQADVYAAVEEQDDAVVLSGIIESEEQRLAAFDIVQMIAPHKRIIDDLEIEGSLPDTIEDGHIVSATIGDAPIADTGVEEPTDALEPGDFTEQRILENPYGASGPGYTAADEDEDISEGEEVFVPPVDPTRDAQNEVLGGFSTSAMDEVEVDRSSDGRLGESAIEEAVLRELREDAATNGLEIEVTVRRGIARLRGRVADVLDIENATEVASRVPGVIDVLDELEVQTGNF